MSVLFWIWMACGGSPKEIPGDIICGEGTHRSGEICVPNEDTGDGKDS